MGTFTDTKEREIIIELNDDGLDVVAKHDDLEIGIFSFDETDCDKGMSIVKLMHMAVNEDYKRVGIATEMMKMAADVHGKNFSRPALSAIGGQDAASEDYFTEDGAALIRYCISKKILNPDPEENEGLETEKDWRNY